MRRWLFARIYQNTLLYNQCWEDPMVDHAALEITPNDRIVMITSAGCNALDYLLKGPSQIDCVDLNPHQTALLELKLVALARLSFPEFFSMFGKGKIPDHRALYERRLRPLLGNPSRGIWDKRIDYFDANGRGLYFHGAAGLAARAFRRHIERTGNLARNLEFLQTIRNLQEQADFYRSHIAPALWSPAIRWALRRSLTMALLGVPIEQIRQIQRTTSMDLSDFIQAKVDRVFTSTSIANNYFWRVYINGCYAPDCCPNYLKEENFERLRQYRSRIKTDTTTVTEFLATTNSGPFTAYVLLDHMDWLTRSPQVLEQEWRQILRTAAPGARIIYRSGGSTFDHIPDFAIQRMEIHRERARALHELDRVGTYGSFHFASVTA